MILLFMQIREKNSHFFVTQFAKLFKVLQKSKIQKCKVKNLLKKLTFVLLIFSALNSKMTMTKYQKHLRPPSFKIFFFRHKPNFVHRIYKQNF